MTDIPMYAAIQRFTDNPHYDRALRAIKPGFIAGIRTVEDARRAADDIASAAVLLGAVNYNYREAIKILNQDLMKCVRTRLMPACTCKACKSELREHWEEIIGIFERHLPAEVWERVGELTRQAFEGLKDREEGA